MPNTFPWVCVLLQAPAAGSRLPSMSRDLQANAASVETSMKAVNETKSLAEFQQNFASLIVWRLVVQPIDTFCSALGRTGHADVANIAGTAACSGVL
eukprot:SAG31_NODE_410_length_15989_cov_237.233984_3_plen_97_part_00